ncbi:CoA-binding protein [Jannaschia sp. W003]|uniref:CoA-binding protein n=1 Tax=Jannaschia sp. W003 TaxID=2867012 RepID=UPI0021A65254|nr:CoA-binding protein [Jannaschia sp. W003]UWQ21125.1 CoA-binding protein [Jannaschia sp. W003]
MTAEDARILALLRLPARVAIVGASPNPVRASHYVGTYLARRGYAVEAVNPGHAGTALFGRPCAASLADLAEPPDILDLFRRADAAPGIVAEALERFPALRCVWLQLGIRSAEAAGMCAEAGVAFVEDRCPKIELQRLGGELRQGGFNTGMISSKLTR